MDNAYLYFDTYLGTYLVLYIFFQTAIYKI